MEGSQEAVATATNGNASRVAPPPKPPRPLTCYPDAALTTVEPLLQHIRDLRKPRPLFVLVADPIDDTICQQVVTWREEIKAVGGSGLDVLIHSPGGSLSACYQTARFLARYVDEWEGLVPAYAASGATLILLGSSCITMSDASQLGPIDPQVISKRQQRFFGLERQSPLEAFGDEIPSPVFARISRHNDGVPPQSGS